jgi:2-polyprenyl-3-methyl-5-hydroxy-6-metoxy-1,4-benzoquinol methylase
MICGACHAVQSRADHQWFDEIREIYGSYYAYRQADGVEQSVPDGAGGELRRRSDILLTHLSAVPGVPNSGKVLDVGCGTGATLRAFSKRGQWRLYGLEIDNKNLPFLEVIEGFESLYTCAPGDVPERFDLVTMVHALEHFPDPLTTLRGLRKKVTPGGRLFVEVPNADDNPFDYVIADHMMHFTSSSLTRLAVNSGFKINCLSDAWVAKELSMTAQPADKRGACVEQSPGVPSVHDPPLQIDWLKRVINVSSQAMAISVNFGLFGTAVAATWLCNILGDKVSFFVEEDPTRIGRLHMRRPVIAPHQVKPGSAVFMPLTPQVANQIASRLSGASIELILPPSFLAQNAT